MAEGQPDIAHIFNSFSQKNCAPERAGAIKGRNFNFYHCDTISFNFPEYAESRFYF